VAEALIRERPGVDAALEGIAARAGPADRGELDLNEDVKALAAAGLIAAPLPPAAGGRGLGTSPTGALAAATVLRDLGRANLSVARLFEGHVNAVKLVALYGGPAARERVFAAVRSGRMLGVWGADGRTPVTLRPHDDGFVLEGEKRFASGLDLVDQAVVTAKTGGGVLLVLMPARDPRRSDPRQWTASGMRATRSGIYDLSGLIVPADSVLGEEDAFLREPHFEGGVWRYAAAQLGGAEALHDAMLDHLLARSRAGDPHQEVRIAGAATACETGRLWVESVAQRVEAGPAGSDAEREGAAAYALLAREAVEAACLTVMTAAERAMGMAAYAEGTPAERIRRDLGLYLRQAVPDAKRSRAARALLAGGGRAEML